MWIQTTPDTLRIGDSVKEGTVEQLVYGRVRAWMIGGAYAFGK